MWRVGASAHADLTFNIQMSMAAVLSIPRKPLGLKRVRFEYCTNTDNASEHGAFSVFRAVYSD